MRWLVLCILVLEVATCGQKGPLSLPDASAVSVSAIDIGSR
jgi:predicted small lipoprotein YifL